MSISSFLTRYPTTNSSENKDLDVSQNNYQSVMKTYNAEEDNGRLAAWAKELDLNKQRQSKNQVRASFSSSDSSSLEHNYHNSNSNIIASQHYNMQNCTNFAGNPLTPVEAQAKLDRCPTFRRATFSFAAQQQEKTNTVNSQTILMNKKITPLVTSAIALDYGIRLRNCLQATTTMAMQHASIKTLKYY
eukprot:CAMPEP_0194130632 /NCGR_PEP_ID=MMETSP0152-20130528/1631_1 /TAXON_ID=1049557 /ORGANISM="Thalassiothrix antarctica, Strain L6-D1" /LENGTH=188 /DNA_ID=CAMNT_0038825205 /DNA_START=35 /DNA_END=601 /DNA_ORIENTATION=+